MIPQKHADYHKKIVEFVNPPLEAPPDRQSTTPAPDTPLPIRSRRPGQWCWLDTAVIATYGPRIGASGVAVAAVLGRG
jgi:hypothetical protein